MAKINYIINDKGDKLKVGDQITIEDKCGYWEITKLRPKFPKYPRNYPKGQRLPYENYNDGLLCREINNPKNEIWVHYKYCNLFKMEQGKYYGIYD